MASKVYYLLCDGIEHQKFTPTLGRDITPEGDRPAARLYAWANAMREKMGDPRPPVEQNSVERDLAVIHSHLNDSDFAKLWAEGQRLTVDEAAALALKE